MMSERTAGWVVVCSQNLVQLKWESLGKLSHGGTHEKAKDRQGSDTLVTLYANLYKKRLMT